MAEQKAGNWQLLVRKVSNILQERLRQCSKAILQTILDFTEARDDRVAVALAGPHANRLHTMPVPHHSVFTGQMPFWPPNQQCQSTGNKSEGE